jgi:hypothetical protein
MTEPSSGSDPPPPPNQPQTLFSPRTAPDGLPAPHATQTLPAESAEKADWIESSQDQGKALEPRELGRHRGTKPSTPPNTGYALPPTPEKP